MIPQSEQQKKCECCGRPIEVSALIGWPRQSDLWCDTCKFTYGSGRLTVPNQSDAAIELFQATTPRREVAR